MNEATRSGRIGRPGFATLSIAIDPPPGIQGLGHHRLGRESQDEYGSYPD